MLGVIDTIMGTQCRLRAGETKTFVAKPRKRGDDEPEIGYCIPMALITFVELRDDSDIEEEWINLYSGVEMPETKIEECPFSIEASALSSQ
uniref:DUF2958 domain-containing protein n=1 Tax=Steinernema glaseri TaxID=37863 RepID=A0A1I7ZWP1_9BILA